MLTFDELVYIIEDTHDDLWVISNWTVTNIPTMSTKIWYFFPRKLHELLFPQESPSSHKNYILIGRDYLSLELNIYTLAHEYGHYLSMDRYDLVKACINRGRFFKKSGYFWQKLHFLWGEILAWYFGYWFLKSYDSVNSWMFLKWAGKCFWSHVNSLKL